MAVIRAEIYAAQVLTTSARRSAAFIPGRLMVQMDGRSPVYLICAANDVAK